MLINEIFYSLQGEGLLSGFPTIFIRTAGCNLRCSYCDTTYAYNEGTEMTIPEILQAISSYDCNTICITGGEPLLQKQIYDLLNALIKKGYSCSIETNGSQSITKLTDYKKLLISLDMKCPSSDMQHFNDVTNLKRLRAQDQFKCVISSKKDFTFAQDIIHTNDIPCPIYFQPVWGSDTKTLATWILSEHLPVRLGLQHHKLIWGNHRRR